MDGQPLQGRLRLATVFALVLATATGIFAATEAMALMSPERPDWSARPPPAFLGDPALVIEGLQAQAAALEPLRAGLCLVLCGLAVACALASVSSARLLRPRGLPRDAMRRLLGGSLLAAAVLRTLNGALIAAVMRQVGVRISRSPNLPAELSDPATLEHLRASTPALLVTFSALWTALVAGTLLLLAQYFRSERVRDALKAGPG